MNLNNFFIDIGERFSVRELKSRLEKMGIVYNENNNNKKMLSILYDEALKLDSNKMKILDFLVRDTQLKEKLYDKKLFDRRDNDLGIEIPPEMKIEGNKNISTTLTLNQKPKEGYNFDQQNFHSIISKKGSNDNIPQIDNKLISNIHSDNHQNADLKTKSNILLFDDKTRKFIDQKDDNEVSETLNHIKSTLNNPKIIKILNDDIPNGNIRKSNDQMIPNFTLADSETHNKKNAEIHFTDPFMNNKNSRNTNYNFKNFTNNQTAFNDFKQIPPKPIDATIINNKKNEDQSIENKNFEKSLQQYGKSSINDLPKIKETVDIISSKESNITQENPMININQVIESKNDYNRFYPESRFDNVNGNNFYMMNYPYQQFMNCQNNQTNINQVQSLEENPTQNLNLYKNNQMLQNINCSINQNPITYSNINLRNIPNSINYPTFTDTDHLNRFENNRESKKSLNKINDVITGEKNLNNPIIKYPSLTNTFNQPNQQFENKRSSNNNLSQGYTDDFGNVKYPKFENSNNYLNKYFHNPNENFYQVNKPYDDVVNVKSSNNKLIELENQIQKNENPNKNQKIIYVDYNKEIDYEANEKNKNKENAHDYPESSSKINNINNYMYNDYRNLIYSALLIMFIFFTFFLFNRNGDVLLPHISPLVNNLSEQLSMLNYENISTAFLNNIKIILKIISDIFETILSGARASVWNNIQWVVLIIIFVCFFRYIYVQYSNRKLANEIYDVIKKKLKDLKRRNPDDFREGITIDEIVTEFSQIHNISENDFRQTILPLIKTLRSKDKDVKLFAEQINGKVIEKLQFKGN